MTYLIIEIQVNQDGTVGNLVYSKTDLNEALSTFHSILASAAVSTLRKHTAVVMNENGEFIDRGSFERIPNDATPDESEETN